MQKGGSDAEAKTRWWQLPWTPPVIKEQSEEELARKAAIKEKQGQRLRDMANAKRESKIADLEANVQGLEYLLQVGRSTEYLQSFRFYTNELEIWCVPADTTFLVTMMASLEI